eukprot:1112082-Rhodomonas_salina.4
MSGTDIPHQIRDPLKRIISRWNYLAYGSNRPTVLHTPYVLTATLLRPHLRPTSGPEDQGTSAMLRVRCAMCGVGKRMHAVCGVDSSWVRHGASHAMCDVRSVALTLASCTACADAICVVDKDAMRSIEMSIALPGGGNPA